jgi:hypothetical protein
MAQHLIKQFWKEILLILLIKSILLTGIWYKCFRHPMQVNDKSAMEHLIG